MGLQTRKCVPGSRGLKGRRRSGHLPGRASWTGPFVTLLWGRQGQAAWCSDLSCVPKDTEKGRRKLQVCDSE